MNDNPPVASLPRVAVIGVGTMGAAMAARLLASDFQVDVWSRHSASTSHLVDLGATSYPEVKDAVANADVVLTMLPTAQATLDVMFEAHGLHAMRRGATWVQMATVGVGAVVGLGAKVVALRPDVELIDAPVSGSRGPAEAGQLLILASGDETRASLLASVFGVLGRKTMWLGPLGMGSRVKLILNTWLAFQVEGAAESAFLAHRLGLDPVILQEALRDNPIASPFALVKLDKIIHGDYHTDFALDLALKDLDLVRLDAGVDTAPVTAVIAERWRHLVDSGFGGLDVSAAGRRTK